MKLRIATFNIENLFTRFNFKAFGAGREAERAQRYLPPIVNFLTDFRDADLSNFEDYKQLIQAAAVAQDDDKRQHTALAMKDADAHLLCLQEVDSISALSRFHDFYLKKVSRRDYKQLILHEGNDPRGIDLAAMAVDDLPVYSRSHASMTKSDLGSIDDREALEEEYLIVKPAMKKRGRIFNRDCLELEIRKQGTALTVFVCHFKSMSGGRDKTMSERSLEALAVRHLIQSKFENPADENWIVLGDLNDHTQVIKVRANGKEVIEAEETSGIAPLLDNGFSVNLIERLEPSERWTHYYDGNRSKSQLDYILISPALAIANPAVVPDIIRRGTPHRIPNLEETERYPRIGWDRPKASDHCPVAVTLTIE